jgi:hypothetical protein
MLSDVGREAMRGMEWMKAGIYWMSRLRVKKILKKKLSENHLGNGAFNQ